MSLRADLSGPVLAILVTIAVIAAGIGLMAYFWWVAPTASKMPTLSVVGEPALSVTSDSISVYISLKNVGSESVKVSAIVVTDDNGNPLEISLTNPVTLDSGMKQAITFTGTITEGHTFTKPVFGATLITDGGVVPINVYNVAYR